MKYLLYILFFVALNLTAIAQSATDSSKTSAAADSVNIAQSEPDSEKSSKFVMQKSPFGAIWRTLVLPGWGQVYVENYWKAPIFLGAAATMTYFIIDNNSKFEDTKAEIQELKALNPDDSQISLLEQQREVHRDNRDMSAFYLGIVYLVAAVDAYTGAHLYDFSVDDDISMTMMPHRRAPGLELCISIKW